LGLPKGKTLLSRHGVGPTELLQTVARDLAAAHPEVIIAVGAAAIRAIRKVGDVTRVYRIKSLIAVVMRPVFNGRSRSSY
jgi:hypothetical protein